MEEFHFEELIFSYVDKIKVLTSPQTWGNILLDLSKNDLYVLMYLFRQGDANMSGVAQYLSVPLNTATGIAARLEKKNLIERRWAEEDKRVVTICISEEGRTAIRDIIAEFVRIGDLLMTTLTPEELAAVISAMNKVYVAIERREHERKAQITAEKRVRKISIE